MNDTLTLLTITAASIGFIHTLVGPDHYIPFIMMSRAGKWSRMKTLSISLLCGLGHVLSSVVIGAIGICFGIALHELELIESLRGDIAAWALTAFGVLYFLWGIRRAYLNKPHTHRHVHADGNIHEHEHTHAEEKVEKSDGHVHVHEDRSRSIMTTWALFTIFILGPCEPLIPILMYPAAHLNIIGIAWIVVVFGFTTIATMTAMVFLASESISRIPVHVAERYTHAFAGGMIALSGFGVIFIGM
jgi:ABC-type nickel/cobalt efflux system permease component RcnA